MNKILLVYDDYSELMSMEGTLKKVGFDVVGLSNEYSLSQQVLSFNPDLIVGAGQSGKVSATGIGKRLKEMPRWHGKVVLIFPANFLPAHQDLVSLRVDLVLEAPVFTERLLQVICKLLGHNESLVLDRLHKATHGDASHRVNQATVVSGPRFTTEKETFFVSGQVPEGAEVELKDNAKQFTIDEKSTDTKFNFNIDERKDSFELAPTSEERTLVSDAVEKQAAKVVAISDELQREIIGGGIPQVEKVATNIALEGDAPQPDLILVKQGEWVESTEQRNRQELKIAQEKVSARVSKYTEMTKDIQLSPVSTIQKTEARKRQKEMMNDVDRQSAENQDKLRQQFTKALFKK